MAHAIAVHMPANLLTDGRAVAGVGSDVSRSRIGSSRWIDSASIQQMGLSGIPESDSRILLAFLVRCGWDVSAASPFEHCPRDTKTGAGRRVVGLPEALVDLLRGHSAAQTVERAAARQLWSDEDWVFATRTGGSASLTSDFHEWKSLLRVAGVRDARLHDARHSAATMLVVLGVTERTVMSVMGWSSTAVAARYQNVRDPIRRDVARRMGTLLWSPAPDAKRPSEGIVPNPIETKLRPLASERQPVIARVSAFCLVRRGGG